MTGFDSGAQVDTCVPFTEWARRHAPHLSEVSNLNPNATLVRRNLPITDDIKVVAAVVALDSERTSPNQKDIMMLGAHHEGVDHPSGADDGDELPVHLVLASGVEMVVRVVGADDVSALTALYRGLSPESVYRRFFTGGLPSTSFFERLTTVAERGGLGLVAEVVIAPEPDQLGVVGEVEIEPLSNGNGEIAIVVDGRWRGWLGPYLVELACCAAHRLGMPNLEAEVLSCNRQMRSVTRSRGEALLPTSDWREVRVVFSTDGPAPSWLPRDRPRVLVEQRGVAFDAVSGLEAAGYDVIACAGRTAGRPACPRLTGGTCPLAAGADAIIVAMPASPERDELVAAHRAGTIPVIVVDPGSSRISGEALVVSAQLALKMADVVSAPRRQRRPSVSRSAKRAGRRRSRRSQFTSGPLVSRSAQRQRSSIWSGHPAVGGHPVDETEVK